MTSRNPAAERAAARAQWLAELSGALGEAERLIVRAGPEQGERTELGELRARIFSLRAAVEQLRLGRDPPAEAVPFDRLP